MMNTGEPRLILGDRVFVTAWRGIDPDGETAADDLAPYTAVCHQYRVEGSPSYFHRYGNRVFPLQKVTSKDAAADAPISRGSSGLSQSY